MTPLQVPSAENAAPAWTGQPEASDAPGTLLVHLASMPQDALAETLSHLETALAGRACLVASPDLAPEPQDREGLPTTDYVPSAPPGDGWVQTAADFVNTSELMTRHNASACLLIGGEAQSLDVETLVELAAAVTDRGADLAVPRYRLGVHQGLVNSGILFPATRGLFATQPRFPLALDFGLSQRMAVRLAAAGQRFTAEADPQGLIWPVAEAAEAGFSIVEVEGGGRSLPQPAVSDLNTLLAQFAGSLFADIETKAGFWQRSRATAVHPAAEKLHGRTETPRESDVGPMVESFRLASSNLQEVWSLVLPPHSLLGLKRLSALPPGSFRMPDALWARIVYDFVLAYRLRTLNRGHLLGAFTPLYLAWVASHLLLTENGADPEQHIEDVAEAFEADKPYLVSRWRWPDRFNP